MRKVTVIVFFLSLFPNVSPIYFKHIGVREGLSQISVTSIYQDELGRMWFGTLEGVNLYDGVRVTAFKPSDINTLPGNNNRSITGDGEGNIYFVSDNTLVRYNNRSQRFTLLKDADVSTVASHKGEIWVGVFDSLFVWDAGQERLQFKAALHQPATRLQKIFIDTEDRLWVGTNRGLYVKNRDETFRVEIPSEDIYDIFEDSRKNIWVSTRYKGFYIREPDQPFFHYYDRSAPNTGEFPCEQVRSFAEDDYGNIWMGSFYGLVKYNPNNRQYTVYKKDNLPGSLWHSSVYPVYKDRQGSIWAGTYYGGIHYFNIKKDIFTLYPDNTHRDDCLSFPFVGRMVEDKDHHVWICTEGGGLNFLDRKTRKFTHYPADGTKNSISHNNLKSICYSAKYNTLYIGTHTGGLSIFDLSTRKFNNLNTANHTPGWELADDVVNQVALYNDRYVVFLTQKGLFKLDLETGTILPVSHSAAERFLIDTEGFLWVSIGTTVWKIHMEDGADYKEYRPGKEGWHFDVGKIFQDRRGHIYIGTKGSGLYRYDRETDSFSGVCGDNLLLKNIYCYDMADSRHGDVLISSDKGLIFYHPESNEVKTIDLNTALPISGINMGCGLLVCQNGEVFVGGIDGAVSFFEQELSWSPLDYTLYFSDLSINNETVYPGDPTRVLEEAVPYTSEIVLPHNRNNLKISFTTNNYVNTLNKNMYEYKLEGFDEKWVVSYDQSISYTNLNPGRYTLTVREVQPEPSILPQTIRMAIVIHPPLYATPLFYLLYFLTGAGIIYGFYRFKKSQLLLQASLEIERKEKEKIEEVNKAKLQFFANISHEFRTPLTLIISQVEHLLQSHSIAPTVYNKLLKVYKNTKNMRNLISELLDFRKLEQGYLKLEVQEQDIVAFLKEIYLSFYEYAANSLITYRFTAPPDELTCWFDAKQMQKVFYNLLANAFEYSSKTHAVVELAIEDDDELIVCKVIDTGIGIAKEDLGRLFDRFYRANNDSAGLSGQSGTGIGLSLAKGIVELHHGSIQVESTPGYGSIFIVCLKKGCTHFRKTEFAPAREGGCSGWKEDVFTVDPPADLLPDFACEEGEEHEEAAYTILLVEDNEELLRILQDLFSATYHVSLARNGKEGLEKARVERPDIIVSDVMMPCMTGTEMCMQIKNDFDICHIPVVLLTAFASEEQNIEGLQRGADDYIGKPFHAKALLVRCNNLVRNRIILQKKFSRQKEFDVQLLATNPIDQKFLDTVNEIIEKNLDNPAFDMNVLAKELALSRSSLYAKFKGLTGMTPNDFVLNNKLKRAAILLKEHAGLQIADVSDRLGFGSPRYFTRCFKAHFNMTPAEFRKG
ncbi:MAG: response regulator [Tannerellaceae bacterium]|nr:response regulator [Tannerellaceae bacterium]